MTTLSRFEVWLDEAQNLPKVEQDPRTVLWMLSGDDEMNIWDIPEMTYDYSDEEIVEHMRKNFPKMPTVLKQFVDRFEELIHYKDLVCECYTMTCDYLAEQPIEAEADRTFIRKVRDKFMT